MGNRGGSHEELLDGRLCPFFLYFLLLSILIILLNQILKDTYPSVAKQDNLDI